MAGDNPFYNLAELTDDEDFTDMVEMLGNVRRQHRQLRERKDYFLILTDNEFVQRFRLSKLVTRYVIEKIKEEIMSSTER